MAFLETAPQLPLRFARAKDQDPFGVPEGRDDGVVIPVEVARELPLAAVVRRDFLRFVRCGRADAVDPAGVLLDVRFDDSRVFSLVRDLRVFMSSFLPSLWRPPIRASGWERAPRLRREP